MIRERETTVAPGGLMLGVFLLGFLFLAAICFIVPSPVTWGTAALLAVVDVVLLCGLFMVQPNQATVLQLFGRYVGTVKTDGLRWSNPLYTKKRISLRVRNFESNKLKVNDHDGNPIEIAAVVVWRVVDSAEAAFEVDDYENFVHVQ